MNRRGFLKTILALGCAPAVVRAASLMPVRKIIVPTLMPFEIGRRENIRFIESARIIRATATIDDPLAQLGSIWINRRHYYYFQDSPDLAAKTLEEFKSRAVEAYLRDDA